LPNLRQTVVAITPINFRVRDYRAFVIDFLVDIIRSNLCIPACYFDTRRLILCQSNIVANYISYIKELIN